MSVRIIRARTPEEFYDTMRDYELSRAINAVGEEMKRILPSPTSEACAEVREWQRRKRLYLVV